MAARDEKTAEGVTCSAQSERVYIVVDVHVSIEYGLVVDDAGPPNIDDDPFQACDLGRSDRLTLTGARG